MELNYWYTKRKITDKNRITFDFPRFFWRKKRKPNLGFLLNCEKKKELIGSLQFLGLEYLFLIWILEKIDSEKLE